MKKVCILGLGYIGLPTALTLANKEYDVLGVDINEKHIKNIQEGLLKFREKDLQKLFAKIIDKPNFKVSSKPNSSDIYIIAVPTPFLKDFDKVPKPDISFVLAAIRSIVKLLKKENLIIIESTCPVGTTEIIQQEIFKSTGFNKNEINLAYCPERVLPGNTLNELVNNDRIVGGLTDKASEQAFKFYSDFCNGGINITNAKTAELAKLTENAFRDVNIAFANELSIICDDLDINSRELIKLTNKHPRVNILNPGCGVGGHCIAIDPWFIVNTNSNAVLIKTAREINNKKAKWVLNKINIEVRNLELELQKKPLIGFFGLAFKPDIDDLRESPALEITNQIIRGGFSTLICEPNIKSYAGLRISSIKETLHKADILVFLVAHKEFKKIDLTGRKYLDFCGLS